MILTVPSIPGHPTGFTQPGFTRPTWFLEGWTGLAQRLAQSGFAGDARFPLRRGLMGNFGIFLDIRQCWRIRTQAEGGDSGGSQQGFHIGTEWSVEMRVRITSAG